MSQSVQDNTDFVAKINAEKEIARRSIRFFVPMVLRTFSVCLVLFSFVTASFAQISGNWVGWGDTNGDVGTLMTGGNNVSDPMFLFDGTVDGRPVNDTTSSNRYGKWLISEEFGIDKIVTIPADPSVPGSVPTVVTIPAVGTGSDLVMSGGTITNLLALDVEGDLTSSPYITSYFGDELTNIAKVSVGGLMNFGGTLESIDELSVTGDLTLQSGTTLTGMGVITSGGDITISSNMSIGTGVDLNSDFDVLYAKGKLIINGLQSSLTQSSLGINRGSVVTAYSVENNGLIYNFGVLNSQNTVENNGIIEFNGGMLSAQGNVTNKGTLSGSGMISISGGGSLINSGTIQGGLAVNGNFTNNAGTIKLNKIGDVIRITNGNARIDGGVIDASGILNDINYQDDAANGRLRQYLFLATDPKLDAVGLSGSGRLDIWNEMKASANGTLSGTTGSVLDFVPFYGTWDGTKYVKGESWQNNHQYYWLEAYRSYAYAPYAVTKNQVAVGEYLDKIGSVVKKDNSAIPETTVTPRDYRNTGLWNLLAQVDAISDDPANPLYNHDYHVHQGEINPAALRALDEMSGSIYASLGTVSVHNTGVVNTTVADTLRSDVFKFSYIGNPNNAVRGQAIAPLRFNRWATMFGVGGTTKSDGNASGYEQSVGGMVAGVDRAFWTGTRVGAFLSVAGGEVTLDDWNERSKTVNILIGLYLRQEMYYGYGLAIAAFGQDTYKTERELLTIGHRAESRTHSTIASVYLERGIDIPVYYATFQPFVSFQVVGADMDDFTETMWNQSGHYAHTGLESVEGRTNSFQLGLGTRASSQPIPLPWGQLAMSGNMAWFHDFAGENDRDFIARFANPNGGNFGTQYSEASFRVQGNDPKQDWFNFGLGFHLDRNSTRFFIDGNLYSNSRQSLFTGQGGVVTSW